MLYEFELHAYKNTGKSMTDDRWKSLMANDDLKLTDDEIALGWHFCTEFDGLLVGPEMYELKACNCLPKDHSAYKTIPPEESYQSNISPYDI